MPDTVWDRVTGSSWRCQCCGMLAPYSGLRVYAVERSGGEWQIATRAVLEAAGLEAPDPTDPMDLRVPSFERVSHIDFDDVDDVSDLEPADEPPPWRHLAMEVAQAIGSTPAVQRRYGAGDDLTDLIAVIRPVLVAELADLARQVALLTEPAPEVLPLHQRIHVVYDHEGGPGRACSCSATQNHLADTEGLTAAMQGLTELDLARRRGEPHPLVALELLRLLTTYATRSTGEAWEAALEGGASPLPDAMAAMSVMLERGHGHRFTGEPTGPTSRPDDEARGEWLSLAAAWHDHETADAWDRGDVLPWLRRVVELADDVNSSRVRPIEQLCGLRAPGLFAGGGTMGACRKPAGHKARGDRKHAVDPASDPDTTFTWEAQDFHADGNIVRPGAGWTQGHSIRGSEPVAAMCATPEMAAAIVDLWNRFA